MSMTRLLVGFSAPSCPSLPLFTWAKPVSDATRVIIKKARYAFMGLVLEIAIDFGAVLDAVDADESLRGINPVEDAPVADAEFAQARKFVRHSDETPVNDGGGVFREPRDLALDACADSGVERGKLRIGLGTYFDSVGHEMWRGVQGLN